MVAGTLLSPLHVWFDCHNNPAVKVLIAPHLQVKTVGELTPLEPHSLETVQGVRLRVPVQVPLMYYLVVTLCLLSPNNFLTLREQSLRLLAWCLMQGICPVNIILNRMPQTFTLSLRQPTKASEAWIQAL